MGYLYLSGAILSEVVATTALKSSDGFSRLGPSTLTVFGYGFAFYFLALTLKFLPTGVAYAIWSGVGIILISLLAWLIHGQRIDLPAATGMALIIAGVAVLNLFSKAAGH